MGYVYLIEDTYNNSYKIGVAKDVNKRIKALQTGNVCKLKLIYSYETKYPYRLESMLHSYYKQYNVFNEWFELENPKEFLSKCDELSNIIESLKDNPFFNKNLK